MRTAIAALFMAWLFYATIGCELDRTLVQSGECHSSFCGSPNQSGGSASSSMGGGAILVNDIELGE